MTRIRLGMVVAVAAVALLVLSACSVRLPGRESLETAIPEALLASDLGITESSAGKTNDGFAVNVSASATFDRGSVTADELREILRIVVANVDLSNVTKVSVFGTDGTLPGPGEDGYSYEESTIDLSTVGAGMGFEPSSAHRFVFIADWTSVTKYLEENPE